jgi:hypothetical protein
MTQLPPSWPTHRPPEPNPSGVRHRALGIFLVVIAVVGLFGWMTRRNPSPNATAAVSVKGLLSKRPSGPRNGGPLASADRGHHAPGPDPARKVDEDIARILRGELVTNIYTLSSNETMVGVQQFPPIFRQLGTEVFETLAEAACQENLTLDPSAAEYQKILEEHPAARDSGRIWSGVYLVYGMGANRRDRYNVQGSMMLAMERQLNEANKIADPELRERQLESIRTSSNDEIRMDRLKQQFQIDRTRRLLDYLYGDMPKAVFQRLVSIEPALSPDEIQYP